MLSMIVKPLSLKSGKAMLFFKVQQMLSPTMEVVLLAVMTEKHQGDSTVTEIIAVTIEIDVMMVVPTTVVMTEILVATITVMT
jgi:hypothetical protein